MMNHGHGLFFESGKWGNDVRKLHLELIAHNEIKAFNASKHVKAGLGITAGYNHKGLWGMAEDLTNDSTAFHLSPFRDRAGIDHEDIRFLTKRYRDKPGPLKSVLE